MNIFLETYKKILFYKINKEWPNVWINLTSLSMILTILLPKLRKHHSTNSKSIKFVLFKILL
jgi:hypothetical protein